MSESDWYLVPDCHDADDSIVVFSKRFVTICFVHNPFHNVLQISFNSAVSRRFFVTSRIKMLFLSACLVCTLSHDKAGES